MELLRVIQYSDLYPEEASNLPELFESLISFSEFMKSKPVQNIGKVFNRIIREAKPVLQRYNA